MNIYLVGSLYACRLFILFDGIFFGVWVHFEKSAGDLKYMAFGAKQSQIHIHLDISVQKTQVSIEEWILRHLRWKIFQSKETKIFL